MSVVINTNTAATNAAVNLSTANAALQKSLAQLSSGSKITSPSDDAGGLAVSMRMTAAINRTDAANTNIQNAVSFLQTQDGALKTAGDIMNRISQLKMLSNDQTKTSSDIANYNTEFNALQSQLSAITSATFNGVQLFSTSSGETVATSQSFTVYTAEDMSTCQTVAQSDLAWNISGITASTDLNSLTIGSTAGTADVSNAITALGTMRAQNGAEQSDLGFASALLTTNETNLQAANSRIVDVDVASASTDLAKNNILVQAGTSMLSQANSSAQIALKLLQ
jgi:flagellin